MYKILHLIGISLISIGSFVLGLYFFAFTSGTSEIAYPSLLFAILGILLGTSLLFIKK